VPEQLLFALMEGAHLGPERLGALCSLAPGLAVKRPFQQRLRLARRQVRGERVKFRGLGGEQLLDIAREPDIERAQADPRTLSVRPGLYGS